MGNHYKNTPIGKIPEDWEVVRLGEISEFKRGFSYRSNQITKKRTNIRFITINDIKKDGGLKRNAEKIYIKDEVQISKDFFLECEDILIANTDMSKGFIIGAPLLIEIKNDNEKLVYSMDLTKLILNKLKIYTRFLFYMLSFIPIRQIIKTFAQGTNVLHLNHDLTKNLKIPLPPLEEQRKIAEILSTVDKAIEKVDEAIAKTERLKKGLMQELLTKGIGHKEFKYSKELGCEIPKEWEVVRLGDIAKLESGATPNRRKPEYWENGTIPWIKSGELNDGVIYDFEEKITELGLKNSSAKIFPKGTLLIALYGRGTVSKTAILGIDAATNQAVAAIIPINSVFDPKFMQYYLIHSRNKLLSQLVNPSSDVGRTNIYLSSLKLFKVPLPPLEEQRKIAEILSTVDKKLELEKKRKEKLERIKKGLMNDLLTGRRRVKVYKNGELTR